MDDLRRELIMLLAAAIYLAGVEALKRLRAWLDRREAPHAAEEDKFDPGEADLAEAQRWLDDLKRPDPDEPSRPAD